MFISLIMIHFIKYSGQNILPDIKNPDSDNEFFPFLLFAYKSQIFM